MKIVWPVIELRLETLGRALSYTCLPSDYKFGLFRDRNEGSDVHARARAPVGRGEIGFDHRPHRPAALFLGDRARVESHLDAIPFGRRRRAFCILVNAAAGLRRADDPLR